MYGRSVKELMSRELITCTASTPVEQVMKRLLDHTIHAVVVVDEQGYAVGIVSQTDVLRAQQRMAAPGAGSLSAGEIMSANVIACDADTTLLDAVTLMTRNHIHRLVVAKPGAGAVYPLGILSMTDVIRYVINDKPAPLCLQGA